MTMTTPLPKENPNEASGCSGMATLLGAHLDGQLDAVRTLEIEDHLASCEPCRERLAFDRAVRTSLKKAVRTQVSGDARARMLAAMTAAASEENAESEKPATADAEVLALPSTGESARRRERGALRHWRTMLPLASAAAIAVGWGFAGKQPLGPIFHGTNEDVRATASIGGDDLLRELVAVHSHPLSPERTDPKDVRALERDVGIPVRLPHLKGNARFVGGRVLPVRQGSERAAMLQYEIVKDNHVQRVSVFVYDPRRVQVSGPGLAPRAVGTAQVRVGQSAGYSVAVTQRGDIGYAFASDMDPDSSANLAADAE